MKKKADYVLLLVFISMILTFYTIFIIGQKEVSETENRTLAKLETFEIKNFIDKTFQNNLENAISDQMILSQKIKKKSLEIRKNIVDEFDQYILKLRNNEDANYYVAIAQDNYKLNNEEWLIDKDDRYTYDSQTIQYFNKIENVDKYLYFIESDRSKTYQEPGNKNEIYEDILAKMELKKYDKFTTDTFEEYKEYFYKTDHHWNHKGQYKAYQDILNLLGIDPKEMVNVIEERQYNIDFLGSKAREATEYNIKEKFTVYKYDNRKPKEIYIDGQLGKYGESDEYDKGEYNTKQMTNHYGEYYGGDNAEIIYNFDAPEKENLLIISNSYSNAINEIVSSHFNKTYIIDLRRNTQFNPNEYIQKNRIDKVLILGETSFFSKKSYFRNIDLENI